MVEPVIVVYFIFAIPLALVALIVGGQKLVWSKAHLAEVGGRVAWASELPAWQIKLTATIEVLAAIGLILPMALDVASVLSPISALALALTHVGAFNATRRRGEKLTSDIAVFALTGVIAVLGFLTVAGA
ncbi:DoxX family protein [Streptomyces blattellae]|uniref:DoxX family protein n=1 Tax=Streptomyces blattellae TaxID=2569855 RepID=UPI0012B8ECC9|nr:DoxX family protein [Streptomyces blattellae]